MMITPVELRHKLHRNPELAFNEYETTKLIKISCRSIEF